MKQMDRADRLLGDDMKIAARLPRYLVEYDHPCHRVIVDYSGEVHLDLGVDGNTACGCLAGGSGTSISFRSWGTPFPCEKCFMHGDLLSLRISLPEYTEMEEAESWLSGSEPLDLDSPGAMAAIEAQLDLNGLAGLLMGADPWR